MLQPEESGWLWTDAETFDESLDFPDLQTPFHWGIQLLPYHKMTKISHIFAFS